jgi:hypothetical protein
MHSVAPLLFVLLPTVVASYIATTTGQLPDPVATHFGRRNLPDGWMSRDGFVASITLWIGAFRLRFRAPPR